MQTIKPNKMKKIFASLALLLLMNVAFLSCKKTDNNQNNNSITSSFYFTADINGTKVTYEDGKNGYGSGAGASSGTIPAGCEKEQSLIIRALSVRECAGVLILKTFSDCIVQCSELKTMFHVGTYTYGKGSRSTSQNGIDGVVVYYVDKDGVQWFSDKGTATQTNSSFKIVEHIDNTDGYSAKITKATFNCTLYDGNGNSKTLTNGEIRGRSDTCM